jgi:glycosyltransferase involved in cell wall biosynthesis
MNILFLTLLDFTSLEEHNIYTDLLSEFVRHGHSLFVISPVERRSGKKTQLLSDNGVTILKLRIGNMQKTNVIEKGISTLLVEHIFIRGIRQYFSDVRFDLVMYSTPPITFCNAIRYVKKRDGAKTYLLLKDIFPQNAVDLGMMRTEGIGGLLYRFFREKEKKLYAVSDRIGCMSQANVDYVLCHNPQVPASAVEICPNSISIIDRSVDIDRREAIRKKYGIPLDKKVFVYGGNLGKPQGVDFIIRCLREQSAAWDAYFLIVGDGTEYGKLESFLHSSSLSNVMLMRRLPKEDYDTLVGACDVGLIFLDYRFTIPNFPSRLLSYMQAKLPVLACVDAHTDVGDVIEQGGFGWQCRSNDAAAFSALVRRIAGENLEEYGARAWEYLAEHYDVAQGYERICGDKNGHCLCTN